LLADLWLIHDVRSAKLDQLFHIVLDQLSRSAQLSRLNIPSGHDSQDITRYAMTPRRLVASGDACTLLKDVTMIALRLCLRSIYGVAAI